MDSIFLSSKVVSKPTTQKEALVIQEIISNIKKEKKNMERQISTFSKITPFENTSCMKIGDYSISKEDNRECGWATILIVDDQVINRLILSEFSSKFSVKWDEADNGKVALQKYKQSIQKYWWDGYKIILMDLNMPIMDGLVATRKILEEKTIFKLPKIVAVTAFWSEAEKQKWFDTGFNDFRLKPIDLGTFRDLLL